MPEHSSWVPTGLPDWDEDSFLTALANSVARNMHCSDDAKPAPKGSGLEEFDPVLHIDTHEPTYYDPTRSRLTAVIMVRVTTWPRKARKADLKQRLKAIADDLAQFVPEGARKTLVGADGTEVLQDKVSVTFMGKKGWAYSS